LILSLASPLETRNDPHAATKKPATHQVTQLHRQVSRLHFACELTNKRAWARKRRLLTKSTGSLPVSKNKVFDMATVGTPTTRPVVNKRGQVAIFRRDKRWCFIAEYLGLSDHLGFDDGHCVGITAGKNRCLRSLGQWPDDVMKLVGAAENPTLHSESLEYEVDQIATYFLCGDHLAQTASRYFWLMLFVRYREYFHIDLEMVDV
jgi:hypothetical protein